MDIVRGFGSKAALSTAMSMLVLAICLPYMWNTLAGLSREQLTDSFASLAPTQWLAALCATALSFKALGRYDAIWHRLLKTGVGNRRARYAGTAAIAVSQSIGLTAVTSGMGRWRCFPELSIKQVATISGAVGLSFLTGWAICAFAASVALGLLPDLGTAVLAVLIFVVGLWGLSRIPLNIRTACLSLLVWVLIDLLCAGTALWFLLPADAQVPWWPLVAAYILALGAGLIGNSPGGVGPFELTLLALLPTLPSEDMVAGLLAFRVVYYLVPFVLGAAYLARPMRAAKAAAPPGPADWTLAYQTGAIERLNGAWAHVLRPFGCPVVLGEPSNPAATPNMPFYKAGAKRAAMGRARGWRVARIADEAALAPQTWDLEGRSKKRLRQALRRAQARQVTIALRAGHVPQDKLAQIARHWSRTHGGELGATMGRYCPATLAMQRTYLILVAGELRGFVSFNTRPKEWSLDLIRYIGPLPDGAIHCAIVTAIRDAQEAGVCKLSLGCVPAQTGPLARWATSKTGLRQFKSLYNPRWSPRYFTAPGPISFALTAVALLWAIQRHLPRLLSRFHHHLASFSVAQLARARHLSPNHQDDKPHVISSRQCANAPAQNTRLASG